MHDVEINLANWKTALMASIPLGGLFSRNATAYKWKAPFRCWMLHESALWRLHDLLTQSVALHQQGHGLGARILLRSGFETLATLIYLNQLMGQVLDGNLGFHKFSDKTLRLTVGSKNKSTKAESINIITILSKCEKRYPGIEKMYARLSESAHPSYEGLCVGYSKIDHDLYDTNFSNRWMELYGDNHLGMVELCMESFEEEYNNVWGKLMSKLEDWIEANDDELEATKPSNSEAET
ncbi:MAG: hypothetical protein GY873_07085 [Bosea sp.]|uniref:hypothetical protein n=1 Tax=Bosea sp. (in: a-proteobacteria) TaxID=1871050 RepID=UPI00238260ED|nr:hypothetical protein [Bosea sp. (in: a-proteobacteria)]MCP4733944.1 hypothetical protein [Bosea sp. (in: a-proteobacteria)]